MIYVNGTLALDITKTTNGGYVGSMYEQSMNSLNWKIILLTIADITLFVGSSNENKSSSPISNTNSSFSISVVRRLCFQNRYNPICLAV